MQDKARRPEIISMMKEMELEFASYAKDSPSTILLNNKMNKLSSLVEAKTMQKCGKEVQDLEKYTNISNDGKFTVTPLPGKEKEYEKSLAELGKCQTEISPYLLGLSSISQYNLSVISGTVENCIDDCEKNISNYESNEMRSCVKNCYNFTFRYTMRTIEDLISTQLDAATEQLQKL